MVTKWVVTIVQNDEKTFLAVVTKPNDSDVNQIVSFPNIMNCDKSAVSGPCDK